MLSPVVFSASTDLKYDGYFESRYQGLTRQRMDTLSLRQRLWVNLSQRYESWEWFGKLGLDFDPRRSDYATAAEVRAHEVYLNLRPMPEMRLSVGRKRILWGVADGRNTMDLINPSDNRDPLATGRSTRRLASDLVALEWLGNTHSLELVWLPRAAVDKQAAFGSPWEPPSLHMLRQAQRRGELRLDEADDPDGAEIAARFSHYGQGLDWYLLYFNGYRDNPLIEQSGDADLRARYRRYQAYGVQVALTLDESTLRLEAAHKPNFPVRSGDGQTRRTALSQFVIGWDYQLSSAAYLNLQLYYDHFHNLSTNDEYGEGQYGGLTFSLSDQYLDGQLTIGARGAVDVVSNESLTEIFAEYSPVDDWKLQLGHYFIDGPKDTALGEFRDNWLFNVQFTYFFQKH